MEHNRERVWRKAGDKTLNELYRELARMNGFLDMIRFDIWNFPDITWVFAKRIA